MREGDKFRTFLRKMSKKGFFEVLDFMGDKDWLHYSEILEHCMIKRIVDSRATVTTIVNGLTDLGLLDRKVTATRPVRTQYKLSNIGSGALNHLNTLRKSIER